MCLPGPWLRMFESLALQMENQILPIPVTPADERLGDDDMEAAGVFIKSPEADIVGKKVVCQQVIRQIIEKALGWLAEGITILVELTGVLILDDEPLLSNHCHLMFQATGEPVPWCRKKALHLRGIEDQPRFAAEAGECAYFRLFSNFRIAASVIGPWVRNCPCREAEKAARISM